MATATCSCGEAFHYSDAQGGSHVKCRCGRFLELPIVAVVRQASRGVDSLHASRRPMRVRDIMLIAALVAIVVAIILINVLAAPSSKSVAVRSATDSLKGALDRGALLSNGISPSSRCPPNDSNPEWRPVANGYEPRRTRGVGRSSLAIDNGTSSDAVLWLVHPQSGKASRQIFVRAHSVAHLHRITAGTYQVQYEAGRTYVTTKERFCHSEGDVEFDDQVGFEETLSDDGAIVVSRDSLTLHSVMGGNAKAHRIGTPPILEASDST
jgi:hypothetical protein